MELHKINYSTAMAVTTCVGAFFTVEFWLFLVKRQLFLQLDIYRLSALGIAMCLPLLLLNGLIIYAGSKKQKGQSVSNFETLIWGWSGFATCFAFGFISLLVYTAKIKFNTCLWWLLALEIVVFPPLLYISKDEEVENNNP